ncbi:MAG TPA: helix-turn-helix transcriptional regulator [Firmicutes bacterium]|nr:helix-turn-helix transcriptional regulator [Bacillota bacterium]
MRFSEALAKRIIRLCQERDISINKLATLSGLPQSTVDSIIRGKSRNPRFTTVKRICEALGITLDELLTDPMFDEVDWD